MRRASARRTQLGDTPRNHHYIEQNPQYDDSFSGPWYPRESPRDVIMTGTSPRGSRRPSRTNPRKSRKEREEEAKPDEHFPDYPIDLPILPFDESYIGIYQPPQIQRPPRVRWPRPSRPIFKRDECPPGWDDQEPDLDPK